MDNKNDEFLEQVRQRSDIIEIVGERIAIKKRGSNYHALCPFHEDKKPSLSISAQKQIYKCFACGAGGDAIRFVMEYDNLSFWETIKMFAQKYGIPIPSYFEKPTSYEDPHAKAKEIYQFAQKFYHKVLLEHASGEAARIYLKKRGIAKKAIETFALGYAPNHFSLSLYSEIKKQNKWDENLIENCGIFRYKKDFLSDRIIFPIRNEKGETIAFGGRTLNNHGPKYLNTAELPWFEKKKILYGLYENSQRISKNNVAIVEGYFDVIACFLCGIPSVSPMGTAFSEEQLTKLKRYNHNKKIFVLFDGDLAGKNASLKTAELFAEKEVDGEIIRLPEMDPYDFFFQYGPKGKEKLSQYNINIYDFIIQQKNPGEQASPIEKKESLKNILPLVDKMKQGIVRDQFTAKISEKFQIDATKAFSELRLEFAQWRKNKISKNETHHNLPFYQQYEISFIFFLLCNEQYIAQATSIISLNFIHNPFARHVFNHFCQMLEVKTKITCHKIIDTIENKTVIDYIQRELSIDTRKYTENKEEQLIDRPTILKRCYIYDFIQWTEKQNEEEFLYSEQNQHFLLHKDHFVNRKNDLSKHQQKDEYSLMYEVMRIAAEKEIISKYYQ